MTFDSEGWRVRVRAAALLGDGAALAALFAEGRDALGPEVAAEWARVLSSLDGGAQSG